MSAQHTPGPWRWVTQHGEQFHGYVVADVPPDGLARPVAQICWRDATANARLIASSPALLSALRGALPALKYALAAVHSPETYDSFAAALRAAEAAITDAEGGV